ncbi:MAG: glutathione S-transferase family protein [Rhodospirillaceae bacterium]|nr:glutathione S-transferase family protein [Rhodospirillaceae bacterium]
MILYDLDHSPFAARVRMAIRAKGLAIALAPPPDGVRSAAFRAINPASLVPALRLDDGRVLAESEVIVEYLEDRFPETPLRAAAPEDRARARYLARIADLNLAEALKQLFEVAKGTASAEERARASSRAGAVGDALALIDAALDSPPAGAAAAYAVGGRLGTADCALVPLLFFVARAGALFPAGDPFAGLPRLAAYWRGIAADPVAAQILDEMEHAQRRRAAARARGEPED